MISTVFAIDDGFREQYTDLFNEIKNYNGNEGALAEKAVDMIERLELYVDFLKVLWMVEGQKKPHMSPLIRFRLFHKSLFQCYRNSFPELLNLR